MASLEYNLQLIEAILKLQSVNLAVLTLELFDRANEPLCFLFAWHHQLLQLLRVSLRLLALLDHIFNVRELLSHFLDELGCYFFVL